MKIQIIEESDNRMIIRFGMVYAIIVFALAMIMVLMTIATIINTIYGGLYGLLLLIAILDAMVCYFLFYEGRLLNILEIDKEERRLCITKKAPWLLSRKVIYNIDQVSALCFVHSNFFFRFDRYLIFVLNDEIHNLESKCGPTSYKVVFRDFWWPVFKSMPDDILEKHRRIATFLGVPYMRRLVTFKGFVDEVEQPLREAQGDS